MCLCDNIGLVALILLGWELRASSITVLCVQAVMILSPLLFMPSLYSHSNSKNFYITCIHSTTVLCDSTAPKLSCSNIAQFDELFLLCKEYLYNNNALILWPRQQNIYVLIHAAPQGL